MEIIDSHVHLPHPVRHLDPKYDDELRMVIGVELAREAMDCVGVDAGVITPNSAMPFPLRLPSVRKAIEMYPDRFAACVAVDPSAPDPDAYVASLRAMPGIVALRLGVTDFRTRAVQEPFASGKLEPFIVAAERHALPAFFTAQGNAKQLEPIARRHPALTIVAEHLCLPSLPTMAPTTPDVWDTLADVLALATYPNVALKFSGATTLSKAPYPHLDIWPNLRRIIDAFGPDRLMWGSDFIRLRYGIGMNQRGPREEWAGFYSDEVRFIVDTTEVSVVEKEKMLAGTARRLLRWSRVGPVAAAP